jgi:DNA-binding NtrC family response regulator
MCNAYVVVQFCIIFCLDSRLIILGQCWLRDRREDIRLLVEHLLVQNGAEDKMADLPEKLREMLFHYDWPGNVRELKNAVQRYLATDYLAFPGQPHSDSKADLSLESGLNTTLELLEKK